MLIPWHRGGFGTTILREGFEPASQLIFQSETPTGFAPFIIRYTFRACMQELCRLCLATPYDVLLRCVVSCYAGLCRA